MKRPWRIHLRESIHRHIFGIAGAALVCLLLASPYILDVLQGNVRIVFYGRVIDETGKGVPGAEVTMNVLATKRLAIPVPFGPSQTGWLVKATTGPDGDFVIDGGRGTDLIIISVEKPGFEKGVYGHGPSDFTYAPNPGVSRYRPNRSRREIFEIRHLRRP